MAGQTCPLCDDVINPGDNVAYQQGVLVHLGCYDARSDGKTPPEGGDEPAA